MDRDPHAPGGDAPRRLHPVEAVLALAFSFVLLPFVGGLLQKRLGFTGMALSELLLVLLPVIAMAAINRVSPMEAFGLRVPPLRTFAGAALAGAGGFYLVFGGLELLQERIAPLPPELKRQLRDLIVPETGPRPLAVDLAALALLPALCEELLFRGALLRALTDGAADRFARLSALLFSALAFGAFHFSLYKFLPTASLGLLFGVVALRAGSVWPSMLMHALNNALVVLLLRAGREDPPGDGAALQIVALFACLPAIGLGVWMVRPGSDRSDRE